MSKKLTIEFVRGEFEKEGYILLTKVYLNNTQKLEFICPRGHESDISWANWLSNRRCKCCANNVKHTIKFIREQFEKEGYILLTKEYINAHQKLKYICLKGHKGKISWNKWDYGRRCPKCFFESNKGKNNPNWNPSLTDEERRINRDYLDYTEWCKAVKIIDSFTCQVCGDNKGGNLVSHHLESYNNNPSLRTALGNGVCLCESCHNNFHHQYGRGNNTRKQFEKFKLNTGA